MMKTRIFFVDEQTKSMQYNVPVTSAAGKRPSGVAFDFIAEHPHVY